jgi:hypothetical protein
MRISANLGAGQYSSQSFPLAIALLSPGVVRRSQFAFCGTACLDFSSRLVSMFAGRLFVLLKSARDFPEYCQRSFPTIDEVFERDAIDIITPPAL